MTIACIDVGYTERQSGQSARSACVLIDDWADAVPAAEYVVDLATVQDYQSGQFYLRELPCIQAVLAELPHPPAIIVVDGYVWLDEHSKPGLGAYLYDALGKTIAVIGVAKNLFKQTTHAASLYRGGSTRPLYITAAGIPIPSAANHIASMHGPHRIPAMLKRVDRLSRVSVR
jgi:deoxyribonuclease V